MQEIAPTLNKFIQTTLNLFLIDRIQRNRKKEKKKIHGINRPLGKDLSRRFESQSVLKNLFFFIFK